MAKATNKKTECNHKWILVNKEKVKRFFSSNTTYKYYYECSKCPKKKVEVKNQ